VESKWLIAFAVIGGLFTRWIESLEGKVVFTVYSLVLIATVNVMEAFLDRATRYEESERVSSVTDEFQPDYDLGEGEDAT
jgi:hypothetical protein